MRIPSRYITLPLLLVCVSGCLKTRAQLREEEETPGASSPAAATHASQPMQEVQPQGQYVIDEIKSEITRMNGRIEDLERAQHQTSQDGANANKEQVKKLETRINELEQAQAQMIEALKKMETAQAQIAAAPSPELYEKGKSQFEAGQFEEAANSLSSYLKSPNPKHQDEATFLRAEAYFALKEYKKAIVDYSRFPEKFTKSRRMPQALLKIGLSFDALGMHEDAKGFYQELVEKFPKSAEAKKAKPHLKG